MKICLTGEAAICIKQVLVKKYDEYVTKAGDTYDALAIAAYNDEKMASYIVQANPMYMETLVFDAGVKLKMPVLDIADRPDTLPPWRR